MDILGEAFSGFPSQEKVAKLLLQQGISVRDGHAYCGDIEQGDSAIGRACGVDRRVVRSTLERISSTPELDSKFSKLRSTLSMVELAPEADITDVLFRAGVSVRQAMVDDSGDQNTAVLLVVVYGKIPAEAIPMLKSCRGVSSILIK